MEKGSIFFINDIFLGNEISFELSENEICSRSVEFYVDDIPTDVKEKVKIVYPELFI